MVAGRRSRSSLDSPEENRVPPSNPTRHGVSRKPVDFSVALLESERRLEDAKERRRQSIEHQEELIDINASLDRELAGLLRSLICKQGIVKVQSSPPLRVTADGKGLERSDGSGCEVGSAGLGSCGVCSGELEPQSVVRCMTNCCSAYCHVKCLQNFLRRENSCPSCKVSVLTQQEVKELIDVYT
eukprot:gnl/TRDRNA2_/TRDRNA2_38087_c0_seq1.p1 gnl/TRDRNA2_/TRDRNA2_38087_c0~~gnl/TRDRNA2_/TRDRNA2_38087_c0_seq1.p1  ORF type:complete len:185 (+),score=32.03 gnl/TRDRNA2_/TRDRNA2_38087_c0_seq1:78-632(+)